MSNIKKIVGVVLALVMALSVATIAFAADGDAYSVTVTSDKATIEAGETATVTVKVTANFNVCAMSIPVFFDNSKVTASAGTTTLANANIVTETSQDVEKYFEGVDHTKDDYGIRALVYIAPYNAEISSYTDTTVMTFTVTANDGATGAVVLECISTAVKTSSNPSGTLYIAKNSSGNATVDSLPEVIDDATVTGATTTINITAAGGDPELILTETGEDYGTIIRDDLCTTDYDGCVFGIDTLNGESIGDYVTTEYGSIEVVANEESGEYTTGATILLKNDDDEVVATYVFIYFGDVNGDGAVDGTDAVAVELHDGWVEMLEEDTAFFYAAEVNYDGAVDGTDAVAIELHDGWVEMLEDQNVIAAGFNDVY